VTVDSKFPVNVKQEQLHSSFSQSGDVSTIHKVGLLIFTPPKSESEAFYFCLITPYLDKQDNDSYGLPAGGRHAWIDGEWKDFPREERGKNISYKLEPFADACIREGVEEANLKTDLIRRFFDVGPFDFVSHSTGKPGMLYLCAVEIEKNSMPSGKVEEVTESGKRYRMRAWLSENDGLEKTRKDHLAIIRAVEPLLVTHYFSSTQQEQ